MHSCTAPLHRTVASRAAACAPSPSPPLRPRQRSSLPYLTRLTDGLRAKGAHGAARVDALALVPAGALPHKARQLAGRHAHCARTGRRGGEEEGRRSSPALAWLPPTALLQPALATPALGSATQACSSTQLSHTHPHQGQQQGARPGWPPLSDGKQGAHPG